MEFLDALLNRANPNAKERITIEYFRDDFTYVSKEVAVEDSSAFIKKQGVPIRGWGLSPSIVFPIEGTNKVAMIVNERDANPNDPFCRLKKEEKFTESFCQQKAQEQEDKVTPKKFQSALEKMALWITAAGVAEIAAAVLIWTLKHWG